MQAKKCDRCGDFYTENINKYKDSLNAVSATGVIISTDCNPYNRYDLCDDCVNELMKFLKKERR